MRTRHRTRLLALGLAIAAVAIAVGSAGVMKPTAAAAACPPGYELERHGTCVTLKHPESLLELELRSRQVDAVRAAPHGKTHPNAFSGALEQRAAMPSSVPGSAGTWRPHGHGPLIANGENYGSVNGLGLANLMGRIDSLTYDPQNKRLFASKGTGGVWMSTDYGDTWRSIGDSLPSQVVGAVAWSSANGGTVVAVSGDPTFGSGAYTGYGAFYSTNLGKTWKKAKGVPDGALGFEIEVDPTNPSEIYAATLFGLFRSTDGGKTYSNVMLPTGECSGIVGTRECQVANVVTDVAIKPAGGVNSNVAPGTVVAAIGWRAGARKNADGTVQSAHNGLYRSTSGAPNTFVKLGASGFTPQERIGRIEFGTTTGANQDKDYLYAIVQDSVLLNGGIDVIDAPESLPPFPVAGGTVLNGVYVSKDFGATWTLMADDNVIANNPATGTAMLGAPGLAPGIQGWYNLWISPDPTRATPTGVPMRLAFGLEEIWQNELPVAMDGPATFKVIGRYFSDSACLMRPIGLPECPHHRPPTTSMTTHPDQHDGVWIPDTLGGVTLAVGNDGGFYKNHVAPGHELDNGGWGLGNQAGFNTLLPYDVAMANDGTVVAGLQDNGHMKITPEGEQYMVYGGDGAFAEIDPANSDVLYEAYTFNAMSVSADGGKSWRDIDPGLTNTRFINPFEMDPLDAKHIVTGGNEIAETRHGPDTDPGHDAGGNSWDVVYDLGTQKRPGDEAAVPSATDPANGMSAIDVVGNTIYAGYCGVCDALNATAAFKSGIATNVGGTWHIAAAQGLPERFITSVAIDQTDTTSRTIYVTLGGYSRRWIPPNTLQDQNPDAGVGHLFKSTDGGETFTDISGNLPDAPATWVTQRGASQLIVGTDVGVFANALTGGTTFAALRGLPVVPITTMNLKPDDPNLLAGATYGRGIWTYTFTEKLPGGGGGGVVVERPGTPTGVSLAGPFGFELGAEGWTTAQSGKPLHAWQRTSPGHSSTTSFGVAPYFDESTATLTSPAVDQPGGWVFVDFRNKRDTEPGFDFLTVEWSTDGTDWRAAKWIWDPVTNDWSDQLAFDGQNAGYPEFAAEKVAFKAPAGPLQVRFRFAADQLISSPLYTGVHVDDVAIGR